MLSFKSIRKSRNRTLTENPYSLGSNYDVCHDVEQPAILNSTIETSQTDAHRDIIEKELASEMKERWNELDVISCEERVVVREVRHEPKEILSNTDKKVAQSSDPNERRYLNSQRKSRRGSRLMSSVIHMIITAGHLEKHWAGKKRRSGVKAWVRKWTSQKRWTSGT